VGRSRRGKRRGAAEARCVFCGNAREGSLEPLGLSRRLSACSDLLACRDRREAERLGSRHGLRVDV